MFLMPLTPKKKPTQNVEKSHTLSFNKQRNSRKEQIMNELFT